MPTQHGFSFFEMLIVLAIICIASAIGLSASQHFAAQAQSESIQRQILRRLQYGKQMAQAKQMSIGFCLARDRICAAENNSLMIFADTFRDGSVQNPKQLLSIVQIKPSGKLHFQGYPYYRQYIRFEFDEIARNDNGTIWYCRPKYKTPDWAIIVAKTGRLRVNYPRHGVVKNGSGEILHC